MAIGFGSVGFRDFALDSAPLSFSGFGCKMSEGAFGKGLPFRAQVDPRKGKEASHLAPIILKADLLGSYGGGPRPGSSMSVHRLRQTRSAGILPPLEQRCVTPVPAGGLFSAPLQAATGRSAMEQDLLSPSARASPTFLPSRLATCDLRAQQQPPPSPSGSRRNRRRVILAAPRLQQSRSAVELRPAAAIAAPSAAAAAELACEVLYVPIELSAEVMARRIRPGDILPEFESDDEEDEGFLSDQELQDFDWEDDAAMELADGLLKDEVEDILADEAVLSDEDAYESAEEI
eukprot:TRINITY_DN75169_c0_g1_i1.p1 TRINITY_DN75169_c0_g1~~TRINITY_DN75169_c0_g1_i1.p1  ORF type:complete len:326 (-),score=77.32 TRINITY_DN75169_c0_g1_i1:79-948(-)